MSSQDTARNPLDRAKRLLSIATRLLNDASAHESQDRGTPGPSSSSSLTLTPSTTPMSSSRGRGPSADDDFRQLFSVGKNQSSRSQFPGKKKKPRTGSYAGNFSSYPTTWTHKFCVLADHNAKLIPSSSVKDELRMAGLGDKKVVFADRNGSFSHIRDCLYEAFPKLEKGGGFTICRAGHGKITDLLPIEMPAEGYTIPYLRDRSPLRQAIAYIIPLQTDLELTPVKATEDVASVQCIECKKYIMMSQMKEHQENCESGDSESKSEDETQLANRHELVIYMMQHYLVGQREESINLINKGMSRDGFMSCMTKKCVMDLIHVSDINAVQLKELFGDQISALKTKYSTNDAYYGTISYFEELVNQLEDDEAKDLVRFATGANSILPNRPSIEIVVNHSLTETSPIGQTCNSTIQLPSVYRSYTDFKKNVLERIRNAINHFGMP